MDDIESQMDVRRIEQLLDLVRDFPR